MSVLSIVFLALTYGISVNEEAGLIHINSIWISNGFLLTAFGGIFASFFVVLLCEMQKYRSNKRNTEDFLYQQGAYLFQLLYQNQLNIRDFICHPEISIPDNLFDWTENAIYTQINALQNMDYATFRHKKESLMYEHGMFRAKTGEEIRAKNQGSNMLRIAILKTRIEKVMANSKEGMIHSSDQLVNKVLQEQLDKVLIALKATEQYVNKIDQYCDHRFDWEKQKQMFIERCPHLDLNNMVREQV